VRGAAADAIDDLTEGIYREPTELDGSTLAPKQAGPLAVRLALIALPIVRLRAAPRQHGLRADRGAARGDPRPGFVRHEERSLPQVGEPRAHLGRKRGARQASRSAT
jgi:hypothetical protein